LHLAQAVGRCDLRVAIEAGSVVDAQDVRDAHPAAVAALDPVDHTLELAFGRTTVRVCRDERAKSGYRRWGRVVHDCRHRTTSWECAFIVQRKKSALRPL